MEWVGQAGGEKDVDRLIRVIQALSDKVSHNWSLAEEGPTGQGQTALSPAVLCCAMQLTVAIEVKVAYRHPRSRSKSLQWLTCESAAEEVLNACIIQHTALSKTAV